jgi:hypothetical protein
MSSSYESFPHKQESVCEKILKYCTPSKSESPAHKTSPPVRRRRRSVYSRNERSTAEGEICICEYKQESVEE